MADTKTTALTELASPALADIVPIIDDPSGSPATKKITLANLLTIISTLTAETTIDGAADYFMFYDASASGVRKGLPNNLPISTAVQTALDAKAASSHSHATSDVTSGTFADARIAESNVTQHQAALSITESQISDLGSYATASDITTAINNLIDSSPGALDTLNELAAALGDDADFAGTVTTALAAKVDSSGLSELIDDRVAAILTEGTGITLTYDDGAGTLTIEASGGGGGSTLPIADTTGVVKGSADATKVVRFEADGLTTGTTRVLTVQDADGTIALTSDITTAISNLIDSSPGALDTLNELAAALGDDADFAGTVTTALAAKGAIAGQAWTGDHDFSGADSLVVPHGGNPTIDAVGKFALDTTVADYTGMMTYHDGTEALIVLAVPVANLSTTDGHGVVYDAANNELKMQGVVTPFELQSDSLGGALGGDGLYCDTDGTWKNVRKGVDPGLGGVPNFPLASQAEAEAGTSNVTLMSPLRTAQAIAELESGGGSGSGVFDSLIAFPADNMWHTTPSLVQTFVTFSVAQNKIYAIPFIVSRSTAFDRIGCNVASTGSATLMRLGLYSSSNGMPSDLIDEDQAVANTTGGKEVTISETLAAGLYFLTIVANGTLNLTGLDSASLLWNYGHTAQSTLSERHLIRGDHTYAESPASFPSISIVSGDIPRLLLRT